MTVLLQDTAPNQSQAGTALRADELEQAKLQALGNLAAGIVHEINTPVQYITDNLSFLSDNKEALSKLLAALDHLEGDAAIAKLRELATVHEASFLLRELPAAIDDSLTGIRHVAKLVEAVRAFSHRDNATRQFCVNEGIELMTVISRNEWKQFANVETDLAPVLPPIAGSKTQLSQVWLNLITNAAQAIKETGRRDGEIAITSKLTEDWVVVTVGDNGPGMDDQTRSRVFERYFTTKPQGVGTGQGLAICRHIVESHGGSIVVNAHEGKGSEFKVRLPLATQTQI